MSRHRSIVTITVLLGAFLVAAALAPLQAAAAPTVLYATVGPGYTISLKTGGGATVRSVVAGRAYTVVVRDRSAIHNFRLFGPGASRATSLSYTGTVRWNLTFKAGSYRFVCDPHSSMKGAFRAS